MYSKELCWRNGKGSGVWVCTKCYILYGGSNQYGGKKREANPKTLAEQCCMPKVCEGCGEQNIKRESAYTICDKCRFLRKEMRLQRKLLEAKDVTSEYNGMVYWDDEFYDDIEQFIEHKVGYDGVEESELPEWVFACKPQNPRYFDPEDIYERMLDGMYLEHTTAQEYFNGTKELEEALDKFNKANKDNVPWDTDYTKKVSVKAYTQTP